jgi:hypothetical protein
MNSVTSPRGVRSAAPRRELARIAAHEVLEELGYFAGDHHVALTHRLGKILERGGHSAPRLEADDGALLAAQTLEEGAPRRRRGRARSPRKRSDRSGTPANAETGDDHRRARDGNDPQTGVDGSAHQPIAGIGDARRAGVGDQRDVLDPP